jgi:hypothetical protein
MPFATDARTTSPNMTRKKTTSRVPFATANSSFPVDRRIRPVPLLPNRKTPVGYVAEHLVGCNFSTAIMCDEVSFDPKKRIETGYEAALRLLNDHVANCPYRIPIPYGTRLEKDSS